MVVGEAVQAVHELGEEGVAVWLKPRKIGGKGAGCVPAQRCRKAGYSVHAREGQNDSIVHTSEESRGVGETYPSNLFSFLRPSPLTLLGGSLQGGSPIAIM